MNHTEYWAEIRSLVKMAFEEDGLQWSRMAFGAMLADCLENGSDLDWNEIPSSEEEE